MTLELVTGFDVILEVLVADTIVEIGVVIVALLFAEAAVEFSD